MPSRDAVVDACLRRGIDLETLHVDVCSDLDLFFGRPSGRASTPGARQTTGTVQIPIYESLIDHQLMFLAEAVRDAVQALDPQAEAAVREPS